MASDDDEWEEIGARGGLPHLDGAPRACPLVVRRAALPARAALHARRLGRTGAWCDTGVMKS
jgi:hypothetical protein